HARPAARRDADERDALLDAAIDPAHHALPHHRTHRSAEEAEFESGDDHGYGEDTALNDHQRVALARLGLSFLQPLRVAAAVLELERIQGPHFGADLVAALRVEQRIDA